MTRAIEPSAAALAAPGELGAIGQIANAAAAANIFENYRTGKAENTRRRHRADLACFAEFLALANVGDVGDLETDPAAWAGLTWGIVEGFKRWLLLEGFSIASVNARLSTVKNYAARASRAGAVAASEAALIRSIRGYSHKEGRNIDKQRSPARRGPKKAVWLELDTQQAAALKNQPDGPQGRRDRLILCLMMDHGLRCGEVAALQVGDFDLKAKELVFYRPKVDLVQRHKLTADTQAAARAYLKQDAPPLGLLLRGSNRRGQLTGPGMSVQAITGRVKALGEALGIDHLSAHDLRHHWATQAARSNTPVDRLQQAGGWTSPAMALRYVAEAEIANSGVKLD